MPVRSREPLNAVCGEVGRRPVVKAKFEVTKYIPIQVIAAGITGI
jgi:hypothetical protein